MISVKIVVFSSLAFRRSNIPDPTSVSSTFFETLSFLNFSIPFLPSKSCKRDNRLYNLAVPKPQAFRWVYSMPCSMPPIRTSLDTVGYFGVHIVCRRFFFFTATLHVLRIKLFINPEMRSFLPEPGILVDLSSWQLLLS